jgi:hypothetical protein
MTPRKDHGSADKVKLSRKSGGTSRSYRETPDVSAAVCRLVAAIGKRTACGDPEDLAELLKVADTVQTAFRVAVTGLREAGRTDAEIGHILGVTKQAVAQRFPRNVGGTDGD